MTPQPCRRTGNPQLAGLRQQQLAIYRQLETICLEAAFRGWATPREQRRFWRLCRRAARIDHAMWEAFLAS